KKAPKKAPAKGKADQVDQKARKAILKLVKKDGWALEHADKVFKADREIVLAAVKQDGFCSTTLSKYWLYYFFLG
ncbi:MAG TPA: DUF4116 domain-containing protein, partial [Nitrospina sp.]|nr:DUF4116 domain-containing protein [Nitrospina sp.]